MNRLLRLLLPAAFSLLPLHAGAQSAARVTLRGRVLDAKTARPLPEATIGMAEDNALFTIADSAGQFSLQLPPGAWTAIVLLPGQKAQPYKLSILRDTSITLYKTGGAEALDEVVVNANANQNRVASTQVGLETIDRKMALLLPAIMGEVDIIKVFQLRPGVKNSGEGTAGLSVRGGGTDQNLFLLDGTAVYNPSHLFGFFSTFNVDAVKDVQLYKAGFPAEFSGRLSSVIAVNSLKGVDTAAISAGGGIGLISSRLNVMGNALRKNKKGRRLTFNAAARRTYADVFTRLLNDGNKDNPDWDIIPDYYFYDANLRVDYHHSARDQVWASGYYGRDFFRFRGGSFGTVFSWGNTAGSIHWARQIQPLFSSDLSGHYADYNYDLASTFDRFSFNLGSGVREYSLSHKLRYNRIDRHRISFGWSAGYSQYTVASFRVRSTRASENLNSGEQLNALEGGAFVSDEWEATRSLSINAGARFTVFSNGRTYAGLEPRLSVRQMLGKGVSLKGSYARMVQYKHLVASSGASLPTDIWYPSTPGIRPEISDQASAGVVWNISNKWLIVNEAYYKWMRQLVDFRPGANLIFSAAVEKEFVSGSGRGYGNEITIEKTSGKLRGWVGYTWAWTDRTFAAINDGRRFFPRFDRRHELSVVASYPLSKRLTASGSWTFYTGNAVSMPTSRAVFVGAPGTTNSNRLFSIAPIYPERGNYRMPDYHRLDLSLVYKLRPRRGNSDLTLSAYNAYSRRNPFFIAFEDKAGGSQVAGTPAGLQPKAVTLFPIIPAITYNFRF